MLKKMKGKFVSVSSKATEELGAQLATSLQGHETLAFFGDLGSGKTTFLKGVISTLTNCSSHEITSPTFTYMQLYEGKYPIYHFDLYRLSNAEQFESAGFSEYLGKGVCCIEWAEKIAEKLPENTIQVVIDYLEQGSREIHIS